MNINNDIVNIVNQMHKDFPYLNQLGYGLSFPAAIYLQVQIKKQLGSHLQILMATLNTNSPLLYKLQHNVELFRRSSNTNKTFTKFDKNLKLNITNKSKTSRKIYHYVICDKQNNQIYDATAKMFGLGINYPLGFFTKHFNGIRPVANNRYSIVDIEDMLSNRVALITDNQILFEIDSLIDLQKKNYIKNKLTIVALGTLGSIAAALLTKDDKILNNIAAIFVGSTFGLTFARFFNSFRDKGLAFRVMMGDDPELLKRFDIAVKKLEENKKMQSPEVQSLTEDYNKCLNVIFLFSDEDDIRAIAKRTRKCLTNYINGLESYV